MEQWSVRDDRPHYARPSERSYTWLVVTLALALIAALAGGFYWYVSRNLAPFSLSETAATPAPVPPRMASAPPAAPAPIAAQEPAAQPERPSVPVPPPQAAKALPTLEMSDTMMRRSLAGLIGREAFASMVIPKELVKRIVATVDNLPREIAPQRMVPLNAAPGRFGVAGSGEELTLDPANFARYAPYVKVFELVDSGALVRAYVEAYPLFQRAYEQLGYPDRHFNDRLVEAIDDMLAAPEVDGPIALIRPRVLYEFADPGLETRSAGQKILIRMGPANASRVKAKLREIRRELLAAAERRP